MNRTDGFLRLFRIKFGMSKPKARTITIKIECLSFKGAVDALQQINQYDLRLEKKITSNDANLTICTTSIGNDSEPRQEIIDGKICLIYQSKMNEE